MLQTNKPHTCATNQPLCEKYDFSKTPEERLALADAKAEKKDALRQKYGSKWRKHIN